MKERSYNRYALSIKRPHLVLLGAGASLAAFPNGEKNGMEIPLMNNFVETVEGLSDYLNKYGIDYRGNNFEDLYSSLYDDSRYDEVLQQDLFNFEKKPNRSIKDRGQREECGCVFSKDIGQYNTCQHLCSYCYANTSAKTVFKNIANLNLEGDSILDVRGIR
ncbi:MAG: DUF1848 family protein [Desulfobacteria bacterium]